MGIEILSRVTVKRACARPRGSIDDGRKFEKTAPRGGKGFYRGPKQEVGQIFSLRHARIVDYSRGENIGRNLARGNIGGGSHGGEM